MRSPPDTRENPSGKGTFQNKNSELVHIILAKFCMLYKLFSEDIKSGNFKAFVWSVLGILGIAFAVYLILSPLADGFFTLFNSDVKVLCLCFSITFIAVTYIIRTTRK